MGQPQTDWPVMRWDLTAPEWYMLNYVGQGFSVQAFKLAVKELVASGALRVEAVEVRRRLGGRRRVAALGAGARVRTRPQSVLIPVLDLFHGARAAVVPIDDFAVAARKRLGRRCNKYRDDYLLPALSGRRLIRTGGRGAKGTTWTPDGRQAVDDLDRLMEVGKRRLRAWVHYEPSKAVAYVANAGAAILLMDDLYPQFARLGRLLAERRVAGDPVGPEVGLAFGSWDGSDAHGLEALDASFEAVDLGIDAGVGGGGDGGGGDGGGTF